MFEQRLILNRYRIIGRAGAGGYATVQHAFDTRLKRDVAIKCIPLSNTQALGAHAETIHRHVPKNIEAYDIDDYENDSYDATDDGLEEILPSEPGFLIKKEEREAKRAEARRTGGRFKTRGSSTAIGRDAQSRPHSTVTAARAIRTSKNSYAVNTADITKLAGQLPGVISGAGHTKIAGLDDAACISADMIENVPYKDSAAESSSRASDKASTGNSDDVFVPIPSFLERKSSGSNAQSKDRAQDVCTAPHHTISLIGAPAVKSAKALSDSGPEKDSTSHKHTGRRIKDPDFIRMHAKAAKRAASGFEDLQSSGAPLPVDEEHIPGLEEARTAAHLNDANIVTVYDCVVDGQMAYVIMEYVEGKTLARVMRELENDITLDMVTSVFTSVAHALQVAHKAGVLHLDIKPENVVINKDGVVKVTDFGLSTLMDASGQGTTGGGTIGYMPLEQMRQEPLDVRTDEWALASLTYEMLSGINPFRARDLYGAAQAIENAELILPSVCWDVDEEIDDVMFIALNPDLEQRYSSVSDFANDLTPFLGDAKDGKKQLADVVVNGVGDDDFELPPSQQSERGGKPKLLAHSGMNRNSDSHDSEVVYSQKVPFVDKLGVKGMDIVMRVAAALAVCMVVAIALLNFRFSFTGQPNPASSSGSFANQVQSAVDVSGMLSDPTNAASNAAANIAQGIGDSITSSYTTTYGDASVFGLFSMVPLVAWILMVAFAVLAFIRPRFAMPAAYAAFSVMLFFNQAWVSAVVLLLATGAWWWFFGRRSDLDCTLAMMQPLFGSIGFASIVPVLAGALLDVKQALSVCAMAAISAIVFASLGSADVMNWAIYSNFIVAINPAIAGPSIMDGLVRTLTSPYTWCIAISWFGASVLYSVCCWKGTRNFDILGSVACGAVLIVGLLFSPLVIGVTEPLSALQLAGSILPALAGVVFALMSLPDRVRTDYDLEPQEQE